MQLIIELNLCLEQCNFKTKHIKSIPIAKKMHFILWVLGDKIKSFSITINYDENKAKKKFHHLKNIYEFITYNLFIELKWNIIEKWHASLLLLIIYKEFLTNFIIQNLNWTQMRNKRLRQSIELKLIVYKHSTQSYNFCFWVSFRMKIINFMRSNFEVRIWTH